MQIDHEFLLAMQNSKCQIPSSKQKQSSKKNKKQEIRRICVLSFYFFEVAWSLAFETWNFCRTVVLPLNRMVKPIIKKELIV